MHPYPHLYQVTAAARADGDVTVSAADLPDIASAPPPQFDGPGGRWSPETLLCAALADCFILTFRAVARASKLEWLGLGVQVEGRLERADGSTYFTSYTTRATLQLPAGGDEARARLLLEKAERGCLISNSVKGTRELILQVQIA